MNNRMESRQLQTVGTQMKICTFDKMERTGLVQLHILQEKASKFKEQNIMFRTYQDKDDIVWGIPIRVLPNGDVEWQRINLKGDVITYNLKNEREAKEYHIVKNSPFVQGSPTATIDARYKIYNPEAEAVKVEQEFDQIIEAGAFIKGLDNNRLIAYGRLFGIAPDNNSVAVIKQVLLEKAKKDPKAILLKKEKETETEILIVIRRASGVGLIKTHPDRGLVYNEQIGLGLTEGTAIEFLRNNPAIMVDMDRESKQKDAHYTPTVEKSSSHESKVKADKKTEETF